MDGDSKTFRKVKLNTLFSLSARASNKRNPFSPFSRVVMDGARKTCGIKGCSYAGSLEGREDLASGYYQSTYL